MSALILETTDEEFKAKWVSPSLTIFFFFKAFYSSFFFFTFSEVIGHNKYFIRNGDLQYVKSDTVHNFFHRPIGQVVYGLYNNNVFSLFRKCF